MAHSHKINCVYILAPSGIWMPDHSEQRQKSASHQACEVDMSIARA